MRIRSYQHPLSFVLLLGVAYAGVQGVGYDDTPMITGTTWRVHDSSRTPPRVVTPGTLGSAPSDALVLFDGTSLDQWEGGPWKIENGYMEVNGAGSIQTKSEFTDCQLHLEWCSPAEVKGDSQGRGNSGVFLMGRYEVQILDSYDNVSYADGQASALYGQTPPLVNVCRPPGEWQSYDIIFEAPHFEGGEMAEPAYVTVIHNGVVTHHRKAIMGRTAHKTMAAYKEHGPGSIQLQDHGNPVRYRNIWLRELGEYDQR
ncbi:MAG: hypothetical protein ACI9F9_002131 [Candidatus Paceibacteria bacterium]|jgi:hypothetical protein